MSLRIARYGVTAVFLLAGSAAAEDLLEYVEPDPNSGTSAAVLVGPSALAHTGQILPVDAERRLVGGNDLSRQLAQVLANLKRILQAAGSGPEHLVRVHVYAGRPESLVECRKRVREAFPPSVRPAATWTVGQLPLPEALVMMDAVAAVPQCEGKGVAHHRAAELPATGRAHVSILPQGRAVYVSGQAEPGETLAAATRNTLASLSATLEHLGLDRTHVVQIRTFLQPMRHVEQADREIAAFFEGLTVPATVYVEWTMPAPIEIELIAWAPEGTAGEVDGPIAFVTPPGMRKSPLFSRVVVIDSRRALYTSGLSVAASDSAEQEVRSIFDRLADVLSRSGSDFRHLAKATYYVADDDVSRALNSVRPDYYDPQRPPAASKAAVRGAGTPGARISVDMIAVPASRPKSGS